MNDISVGDIVSIDDVLYHVIAGKCGECYFHTENTFINSCGHSRFCQNNTAFCKVIIKQIN